MVCNRGHLYLEDKRADLALQVFISYVIVIGSSSKNQFGFF